MSAAAAGESRAHSPERRVFMRSAGAEDPFADLVFLGCLRPDIEVRS